MILLYDGVFEVDTIVISTSSSPLSREKFIISLLSVNLSSDKVTVKVSFPAKSVKNEPFIFPPTSVSVLLEFDKSFVVIPVPDIVNGTVAFGPKF